MQAEETSVQTDELDPFVITAKGGFATSLRSSPWAINRLEGTELLYAARSLPESLSGLNSVMVQKTALGQSSPYIRGFTGYHNVLLVDGIRINHSAMRSGPNQYWSTVEMLGADRLEIVRGPNGIIHGADAIGGVVNIISKEPRFTDIEMSHNGQIIGRLSSAESSWTAGVKSNLSTPDWFAELSHVERSFGDLEGGRDIGTQKNTGYDSRGSQFRLSRKLNEDARFTIGFQNVFMDDVPRTHKTINGLTWEGLTPGSEIWRQLDQERNLFYGKFSWEDAGGFADAGLLTLSLHKHEQERQPDERIIEVVCLRVEIFNISGSKISDFHPGLKPMIHGEGGWHMVQNGKENPCIPVVTSLTASQVKKHQFSPRPPSRRRPL